MLFSKILAAVIVLLTATGCIAEKSASSEREEFVAWAQENAAPILATDSADNSSDLAFLKPLIGEARLVGLGDSRHDASEQFLLKIRFIEYLVTEMDFNLIALEDGFTQAEQINQYLLNGEGDIDELANRMGAWYIWDTYEIHTLIAWLRQHNINAPPDKQVKFAGIDVTDPLPGIELLLDYFVQVDADFAAAVRSGINQDLYRESMWQGIMQNYASADDVTLDTIGTLIDLMVGQLEEKRTDYVGTSGQSAYEWVLRNAQSLVFSHGSFRALAAGNFIGGGDFRERGMTGNLLWHLASLGKESRGIVWAHNLHVLRRPFDLEPPGQARLHDLKPLGNYLADTMGEEYVAIGMSFHDSDYPGEPLPPTDEASIDGALSEVNHDQYLLVPGPVVGSGKIGNWLATKQMMNGQGGVPYVALGDSFDAVVFIRHITKTQATPKAMERFRSR